MDFAGFLIGAAGYVVGSGGWSHRDIRLYEASLFPIAPCASAPQNPPRKLGEHPLVQETRVPLFRPKVALVNCEEVFHHLEGVRWLSWSGGHDHAAPCARTAEGSQGVQLGQGR